MSSLMELLAQWSWPVVLVSIPLLFNVMSHRKGRDKSVSIWVIMWCQAALVAFSTWRLSQSWRVALAPQDPDYHADFPDGFIRLLTALAVFLIVLPVAWYYRDRRRERTAAGIA